MCYELEDLVNNLPRQTGVIQIKKNVLSYLARRVPDSTNKWGCSQKTIADAIGWGRDVTCEAIVWLVKEGWVTVVKNNKYKTYDYTLNKEKILLFSVSAVDKKNHLSARATDTCRPGRQTPVGEGDTNTTINTPFIKNDLNKQKSVDNPEGQFVHLTKNYNDLNFDERLLYERLLESRVAPSVALKAVSNLAIYQMLDIFKSTEYRDSNGGFEKSAAAYITGGINKLLEQNLPPYVSLNSMEGYQDTTFR